MGKVIFKYCVKAMASIWETSHQIGDLGRSLLLELALCQTCMDSYLRHDFGFCFFGGRMFERKLLSTSFVKLLIQRCSLRLNRQE